MKNEEIDGGEYKPDPDLRDTEQVTLLEDGGIEAFLHREVLPHAKDAWYVPDSVKVGYEISFTRYFYKPQPLRTLEEIRADILALENETKGLLAFLEGPGSRLSLVYAARPPSAARRPLAAENGTRSEALRTASNTASNPRVEDSLLSALRTCKIRFTPMLPPPQSS